MIGEIRDAETAQIGIESALTGHKVLSTLHTNDSPGAVTRFVEMGIEPFLIASTLLLAAAQRLVRRICPDCREAYTPSVEAVKLLGVLVDAPQFYRGAGCSSCARTGYAGRLGVYEVLEITDEVKDMIIRRASATEIKRAAVRNGLLRTLAQNAAHMVLNGHTTFEEFLKVSMD